MEISNEDWLEKGISHLCWEKEILIIGKIWKLLIVKIH